MRIWAIVAVWLALALPGWAETRALLIGVSRYDETIGIPSLRGPANDVRLLRDVLAGRGVTDIRVLADGVDGGTTPDHAAILAGFAALAAASGPGDLAIITMSGHGTRQYDADGDETDGLDEVFLPADTGRAASGSRAIPNALVDDEIGRAVMAIRATGADVFLVMDSCHSGSGLRAASPDSAPRYVDPAVLGLAVDAPEERAASVIEAPGAPPPGQVVAFYAARSSEVAREVNLTPEAPDASGWYGLFTARLAARLADSPGLTYRQLFQAVLSDLNDAGAPGSAQLQTPSWEGGLIDATVLGGRGTEGLRQFAVTGEEVAAGLVQGLGDGTLLALVDDAAAPAEAVLGYAQMEETAATFAYLRPVAADCAPRSAALCPRAGGLPATAKFARLVARPLDLALTLAPLRDLATGQPLAADAPEAVALASAIAAVNAAGAVAVRTDAAAYDVEIAAADGGLWFGRRVAIGQTPVGLVWRPGDAVTLDAILTRIAQAEGFAKLLGSVAATGSGLNPSPVALRADLVESPLAELDPPGARANPARECRRALAAAGGPQALDLGGAPDLKQCDLLRLAVKGDLPGARDVNRVHIDSRFCLHAAHARVEDFTAATPLGEPMVMCSDCPDGYAAGDERLFVIVTEAEANADQLNLEGLVENCGAEAPTRGAAGQATVDFLTALGRRPDTRGAFGGLMISDVWVSEYRWQVLPKSELPASPAVAVK